MQFNLDSVFLFGDGTGKPQGMLNSANPALVVVPKDAGTPNGWITLADILNMWKAMAPACRMRSTWVFSDSLIPAIFQLQLVVRNSLGEAVGGSATPLFTPNDTGGGTLLGREVVFSEKMRSAGSVGDAALIAFDQYAIGMRREISLLRSMEAGFLNDSYYWRILVRLDGQSTWSQTLTLMDSNVVSPFVVLGARGGSSTVELNNRAIRTETSKAIDAPSAAPVVKPRSEPRRHGARCVAQTT